MRYLWIGCVLFATLWGCESSSEKQTTQPRAIAPGAAKKPVVFSQAKKKLSVEDMKASLRVRLADKKIMVGDEVVGRLDARGRVIRAEGANPQSLFLKPAFKALLAQIPKNRASFWDDPVLIFLDQRVSYKTLAQMLYTLGQAGVPSPHGVHLVLLDQPEPWVMPIKMPRLGGPMHSFHVSNKLDQTTPQCRQVSKRMLSYLQGDIDDCFTWNAKLSDTSLEERRKRPLEVFPSVDMKLEFGSGKSTRVRIDSAPEKVKKASMCVARVLQQPGLFSSSLPCQVNVRLNPVFQEMVLLGGGFEDSIGVPDVDDRAGNTKHRLSDLVRKPKKKPIDPTLISPSKPPLALTVHLTKRGVGISAEGAVLPALEGCSSDGPTLCVSKGKVVDWARFYGKDAAKAKDELHRFYPFAGLQRTVRTLRKQSPSEYVMRISLDEDAPAFVLLHAMSASMYDRGDDAYAAISTHKSNWHRYPSLFTQFYLSLAL